MAVAAVVVVALNAVYGFLDGSSASGGAQRTATVGRGTVQSSVSASGNVGVANSAAVDFGTSGTLTAVDVEVGDRVKAGQVLAKIDPSSAQTALQVAQANLDQAESALATARSGATETQKASDATTLQQAQAQLTTARQQLSSDEQAVTAAKKQLATDRALACPPAGTTSSGTTGGSSASGSSASPAATSSGATTDSSPAAGSSTSGTTARSGSSLNGVSNSGSALTQNRNGVLARPGGTTTPGAATVPATTTAGTTTPATTTPATTTTTTTTATPAPTTPSATTPSSTATSAGAGGTTPATATTPSAAASSAAGRSKPSVATGDASNLGSSTVTLGGTVDPSGADTTYRFEYGTSSLGSKTSKRDAGSGSGVVSVTADVAGLKPGRKYLFRLVATNTAGTVNGAQETFTTAAAAKPAVTTSSAASTLTTTATLTGSVDPNGSATTYRFEYGTTASYGKRTAAVAAGDGTSAIQVSAAVSSLKPDTAYLFRLVAANSSGTSAGIGEIAKTSASSCVEDASSIKAAEQTVTAQNETVTTAESSLTQTKATISAGETPDAPTIAQDEATVEQDQATVTADRKALDETTLTAPIAGTITALTGSVGSTVGGSGSSVSRGAAGSSSSSSSAGGAPAAAATSNGSSSSSSSFATIDSLDRLELVSGFAEADATKIAVGQPATITFPALTNTEVAGKVTAVSSTSTVVSNVVTYDVTITLINPPAEVKEGMTANVSVVDQTRSNVLELPSSAITTTGAVSTVELLQNGKTTTTPVTVGLVGNSSTQIVRGLQTGDVVVEPTVTITAASSSGTTGATGFGGGGFGGGAFGGGGGFAGRGG